MEVCGHLFDETTNEPLPYALIIIESSKTETIANDDGFFLLGNIDLNEKILIEYVRYRDKIMNVSPFSTFSCPRILLFVASTSLEEILIIE